MDASRRKKSIGKALLLTTIASLALTACNPNSDKSANKSESKTAAKPPVSVIEASIPDMMAMMKDGRTTSHEITLQYLARIGMYEDKLHAAISVNARALMEADERDKERAEGHIRGPLHGIPIALKDNIMTMDLPTSAGMLAFKNYLPPYEATLVTNLRKAGAIIIAKSTMSELAGWYGSDSIYLLGGYNGAAGQSFNPYDPRAADNGKPVLETSGSSSGGGVAANLWAANVGTSTGGSIEAPSNATMLVGFRPTTGRISRYGIVPLTLDQDTAGPMTKSVTDAAIMFGVLEGDPDPNDPRTTTCTAPPNHDYTPFLKADALKGMRIGIPRTGIYSAFAVPGKQKPFDGLRPDELQSMEDAIAALKTAGAEVVDPADIPSAAAQDPAHNLAAHPICQLASEGKGPDELCSNVLRYGMKRDFNLWLASLGDSAPVKSLSEFLQWNRDHKDYGAIKYGQGRLEVAESMDLEKDKARYEADRASDLRLSRDEGLDSALNQNHLDAILFPGSAGANFATKAGYPIIVVPFGMTANPNPAAKGSTDKTRPFGVSFVGPLCGDPKLFGIAYAFEQATKKRVPPAPTP
jgi:amidase